MHHLRVKMPWLYLVYKYLNGLELHENYLENVSC